MIKPFCFIFTAALLVGCVQPRDHGQQYRDGEFNQPFTQVDYVDSNANRDYEKFSIQTQAVLDKSPSMAKEYQEIYAQLEDWAMTNGDPTQLMEFGVEAEQLAGADGQGNVFFTGYFSPVIEMRHQPDELYKYPVYGMPECDLVCPTRAQINEGALDGMGLELGYASTAIEPFLMEVQGSGFVHFGDDDSLEYFAYAGKNNHAYVSIGRVLIDRDEVKAKDMSLKAIKEWALSNDEETVREVLEHNTSYVFFDSRKNLDVMGTAGIPLQALGSVAADRKLFPMGTPILAEVPLLNGDGSWSGAHSLRLLVVLDTGGAVKDSHLDLYHGMGKHAGVQAGHYKHYGRVWKLSLGSDDKMHPELIEVDDAIRSLD